MQDNSELCYHCGLPVEKRIERDGHNFCCQGCAGAYEMISGSGMLDYYEFRTEYAPRPEDRTSDEIWELIESTALRAGQDAGTAAYAGTDSVGRTDGILKNDTAGSSTGASGPSDADSKAEADFLIEGIHCSSCIWLNETMLRSLPGVLHASGNLATNRLRLGWNPHRISLKELAHRIEGLGYRLLPLKKSEASESQKNYARGLLKRMVVAGFFAGNIMLVSVSLYAGYFGTMDRFTRNFFHLVSFAFATPVMLYSAALFFRTAWASLKHGVLSMDLLTSAGLAVAYLYSIYAAFSEHGEVYFDSVCFVTFAVLAGRYLESRLKLRSLYLIDNLQQAETPFARLIEEDGTQRIVPSETLQPGQRILLKPGESLPCDSRLINESAEVEQSLLTGEFEPVLKHKGDLLLSGIRSIGEMELEVERSGDHSALRQIQKMASESLNDSPRSQKFAELAGRYFVAFVLLASIAAFIYHYRISGLSEAIIITVTLLIVACPCALNLAIPTAFIAGIQRSYASGILFRTGQHLETIARARRIVFDKTGTLTAGRMEIDSEHFFPESISEVDRNSLRSLARALESRSGIQHPVVRAFEQNYGSISSANWNVDAGGLKYVPGRGLHWSVSRELQERMLELLASLSASATDATDATDATGASMASATSASPGGPDAGTNFQKDSESAAFGANPGHTKGTHPIVADELSRTVIPDRSTLEEAQQGFEVSSDHKIDVYLGSFQWTSMLKDSESSAKESESRPGPFMDAQSESSLQSIAKRCSQEQKSAVVLSARFQGRLRILAVFVLEDALRPGAREMVQRLSRSFDLSILSGDSTEHVKRMAADLGIQEFLAQRTPEEKKQYLEELTSGKDLVLMVGDGINDSAALAKADAGISFAGGASLALHSSDILLLNNRLDDLLLMISIARSTRRKILENLGLAFAYNIALLPVAFAGWINPFLGAVFMSLSSITVIVNSIFAGKVRRTG
ncbi:MAG: heavy metal translocating P-type ATPase [Leptospiraceae bacterium]|nr:heavy metal translocating P-type ATPase [Leptospiraceae bacterium]